MVDCTGLENRRTERYRGFESLPLRKKLGNKRLFPNFLLYRGSLLANDGEMGYVKYVFGI